jgi:hypothetical protein
LINRNNTVHYQQDGDSSHAVDVQMSLYQYHDFLGQVLSHETLPKYFHSAALEVA